MSSPSTGSRRLADSFAIMVRELVEILRDRRALFAGIVLPIVLYPLLIFGMQAAQTSAEKHLKAKSYTVAVLRNRGILESDDADLGKARVVQPSRPFLALRRKEVQIVVNDRDPSRIVVYFDGSNEASRAARDKIEKVLDAYRKEKTRSLLAAHGVLRDPNELVRSVVKDISVARSGSSLPLYAPFILILAIMGGSSMAALDAVAGERERGTIETLLVLPVWRGAIAIGKLCAVTAMAIISTIFNLAALLVTAKLVPSLDLAGITLGTCLMLLTLSLPLALLLSAALLAVTSAARSYREAQGYHYPAMLLAFLPASLPMLPGIRLDASLAWIPVGSATLAVSELLRGTGLRAVHLVTLGATTLYAAIAILLTVRVLSSEEILTGDRPTANRALARRSLLFVFLSMLLVYYAGTMLQAHEMISGLLATLYGLILIPALGFARLYGLDVRSTFSLRRPQANQVAGVLVLALALPPCILLLNRMQRYFLPAPKLGEQLFGAFEQLPLPWQIFLIAVSPGICEELMFRGLLLSVFRKSYGPTRAILLSSLLFGMFHLSIYRLVPTAVVGLLLGLVLVRTGSILPCMILHAGYNAFLAFGGEFATATSRVPWGVPACLAMGTYAWFLIRRQAPTREPLFA